MWRFVSLRYKHLTGKHAVNQHPQQCLPKWTYEYSTSIMASWFVVLLVRLWTHHFLFCFPHFGVTIILRLTSMVHFFVWGLFVTVEISMVLLLAVCCVRCVRVVCVCKRYMRFLWAVNKSQCLVIATVLLRLLPQRSIVILLVVSHHTSIIMSDHISG